MDDIKRPRGRPRTDGRQFNFRLFPGDRANLITIEEYLKAQGGPGPYAGGSQAVRWALHWAAGAIKGQQQGGS
jgi:hypothetical protein